RRPGNLLLAGECATISIPSMSTITSPPTCGARGASQLPDPVPDFGPERGGSPPRGPRASVSKASTGRETIGSEAASRTGRARPAAPRRHARRHRGCRPARGQTDTRIGTDTLLHLRSAAFSTTVRTLDEPYRPRSAALLSSPLESHPGQPRW